MAYKSKARYITICFLWLLWLGMALWWGSESEETWKVARCCRECWSYNDFLDSYFQVFSKPTLHSHISFILRNGLQANTGMMNDFNNNIQAKLDTRSLFRHACTASPGWPSHWYCTISKADGPIVVKVVSRYRDAAGNLVEREMFNHKWILGSTMLSSQMGILKGTQQIFYLKH